MHLAGRESGGVSTPGDIVDRAMMERCIELSRSAILEGEYPFGSVIALGGRIVAEAINSAKRERDVSRHAEVIALAQAQKLLSPQELAQATLYSSVEPCAMCSYCIREAWVGRVVYALSSPVMGGVSKWNILRDAGIANRVPVFGPAPEVVIGVLSREARQVWREWSPLAWQVIQMAEILTARDLQGEDVKVLAADKPAGWQRVAFALTRFMQTRSKRTKRG
jgi:tRNA(adenine34) deaminase